MCVYILFFSVFGFPAAKVPSFLLLKRRHSLIITNGVIGFNNKIDKIEPLLL
jgi:hypothetical protein